MRCLIRTFTAEGSRNETTVETAALTIGRGTQNLVQFPGLLVALEHARILEVAPGRYRLESPALAGVDVNGVAGVRETELTPGDRLAIGSSEIVIEPPVPDFDLVVSVRAEAAAGDRQGRLDAVLDLRRAGLSMRRPALLLGTLVLLMGLAIPLGWRLFAADPAQGIAVLSDRFWSPGRISNAHFHFGTDCGTCHERLFVPVRTEACTGCHNAVMHHSDHAAVDTVPDFAALACTDCHREHKGPKGLVARTLDDCTACHARPGRFTAFGEMQAVSGFERHHPEFSPRVGERLADGTLQTVERPLAPELKDATGLVFTHARHLDPAGIRSPRGVEVLGCDSCHKPDAGHVSFSPVRFEANCQGCHQLSVVMGGSESELPHGNSAAVRRLLESMVRGGQLADSAAVSVTHFDLRRRPGQRAERPAAPARDELIAEVFEFRVCARCHETRRDDAGLPEVVPPQLRQVFFTGAWFSHAPHRAVPCGDCHAVAQSESGDDLALPGIEVCRACHVDVKSGHGVDTACVDCHRFHRAFERQLGSSR